MHVFGGQRLSYEVTGCDGVFPRNQSHSDMGARAGAFHVDSWCPSITERFCAVPRAPLLLRESGQRARCSSLRMGAGPTCLLLQCSFRMRCDGESWMGG